MKLYETINTWVEHTIWCEFHDIDHSCHNHTTGEQRTIKYAIKEFRKRNWKFSNKFGGWICPNCTPKLKKKKEV